MNHEKRNFSGNVRLRMPASLHRDLVTKAMTEGVSLNQFACAALAAVVGWNANSASGDEGSPTPTALASPGDAAFERIWRELHS